MPEEFTADENRLDRFQLEARSASSLSHPNILTIFEIGEWEGTHYIAIEYVDGETLRQRLGRESLSVGESIEIGVQLASAIAAAHEAAICHRDIKPENIMIRRDGLVKVVDFGLAKLTSRPFLNGASPTSHDEPTVKIVNTEPGVIMGTVQYMPPEQTRGHATDERSDIWSLGCVLYEMLTGRPPFSGESSADLIAEIVKSHPTPPSNLATEIPERLEEIVSKSLEKNPEERYQTAKDLLIDLKRLKRNLELDDVLERSNPSLKNEPVEPITSGPNIISTRKGPKDLTEVNSAQYLYWGIKAHRWTTIGIGLFVVSLLGGTAYLVRNYWIGPNEARIAYAGKIRLAAQALEGSDLALVERLLNETKPAIGEEDIRGFEWGYLARVHAERTSSQPLAIPHERPVESVAFSPDGSTIATGGTDSAIHIWEAATGEKIRTLSGHSGEIWTLAYSKDGRRLLSGSADKRARVWDVESGETRLILGGPDNAALDPHFTSDGRSIATIGAGTIKLWDAETGKELNTKIKLPVRDGFFALSRDGKYLAVSTADRSITVAEIKTNRTMATLKGHTGTITDLEFTPDSKSILTAGMDGVVKLWDIDKQTEIRTFAGHTGEIQDVVIASDGKTIATGSTDDTVKIWNVEKPYAINTLKGHRDRILALAFAPSGQILASAGGLDDNTVKIWTVPTAESRGTLRGHAKPVRWVTFSSDNKSLASTDHDDVSRMWSVEAERELRVMPDTAKPIFAPNSQTIASGGGGKKLRFWDIVTGRVRQTINVPEPTENLVYSPNGKFLVTGHWFHDNRVRLWESETGREICSFPAHKAGPWFISFSQDGQQIITSALDDNSIRVWSISACGEVSSFIGEPGAGYVTSVAPNGKIRALEVLSNLRSLKMIAIEDGSEIASFSGHDSELNDVQFSPNGDRLATSAHDGSIKIWDPVTGQELLTIRPDAGKIESIAFSPNGKYLAAAGGDGTVRLLRSDLVQ